MVMIVMAWMRKCRMKSRRFALLIYLLFMMIIFLLINVEQQSVSSSYQTAPIDRINRYLQNHAQFFQSSSLPCNLTKTVMIEQIQHYNRISQILTQISEQISSVSNNDNFTGRGIVLALDATQIRQCQVNLHMIEYTETHLPVQLWYSSSDFSDEIIQQLLRRVSKLQISACSFTTGRCQTRKNVWNVNTMQIFPPSTTRDLMNQYLSRKSAAILSSTFAEVLFLDGDSYLVRDPEYLFQSDPMYRQVGALFFPDIPTDKQPTAIWQLLNLTCASNEREYDTGIVLVDKRRTWTALHMAKSIADHSELLKSLFFNDFKDIFRLAFRFLHVSYYMVGIPCSTGHYNGTHFCGLTLCQTDSMGWHVFSNHLNVRRYVKTGYSPHYLGYTRLGLGDPYDHLFTMQSCSSTDAHSCLLIERLDASSPVDTCRNLMIDPNDISVDSYAREEVLTNETGKILMGETNNFMSGFVASLFHYQRQIYGDE